MEMLLQANLRIVKSKKMNEKKKKNRMNDDELSW